MKRTRSYCFPVIVFFALLTTSACKTKKLAQKPVTDADTTKSLAYQPAAPAVPSKPRPAEATQASPQPVAVPQSAYNFSNIQFEFDSGILKTESYAILDNAASVIKAVPSVVIALNGYASAEGTDEHNMKLSVERANAVKTYLVNSGVNPDNLIVKGYGESNPIADNTTEEGRILNRRVEIKKR